MKAEAMISLMFNPFFNAKNRTLEVFLRHKVERDLYGETLRIEIKGILRTSSNYENFSALLQAIYNDIYTSSLLLSED